MNITFLFTDLFLCEDGGDWCAQGCEDTDLGYQCTCREGYVLADDKHTCDPAHGQ